MKKTALYILNILAVLTVLWISAVVCYLGHEIYINGFNKSVTDGVTIMLLPVIILIPVLTVRQALDYELNYDEFGMNRKTGKLKRRLSGIERRNIDLQAVYDMERILGKETIKKMTRPGPENPEKALKEITGLDNIKERVETMAARMEFDKKRNIKRPSGRHMCFYGNPGTGKTTIARIITGFLYKYRYIKENKIIEVDGNFLKASNPTDTAMKTELLVKAAENGVLFIDEAYALIEDGSGIGNEAVATLIKLMEDKRDKFVLIIAGYTEPMEYLLDSNPGFRSRISDYFMFSDYSDNELLDIFVNMAENQGFDIEEKAAEVFMTRLRKERNGKAFANARTVRTLLDEFTDRHAVNLKRGEVKNETCICYKDVSQDVRTADYFSPCL